MLDTTSAALTGPTAWLAARVVALTALAVLLLARATPAPPRGAPAAEAMANPAAVHCTDLGYAYQTVDANENEEGRGQEGICTLPNGEACDAWAFLQGKCGPDYSYCARQGYGTRVLSDGRDPFSRDYAVCVADSGAIIGPVSQLSDLSEKAIGCEEQATDGALPTGDEEAHSETTPSLGDAPSSFDWRSYQGYDWMTPIKNQGGCGSCWAFAAVGVAEAVHNIGNDNPHLDRDLSEQYLVSDCSNSGTCCGGSKAGALQCIRDSGVPDESCMGYVDGAGCSCPDRVCDNACTYRTDGDCSDTACTDRCSDWSSRLMHVDETGSISSDAQVIKETLVQKGPLAVSMGIGADFGGYWDGDVYRCTTDTGTNHAVVIVGYDDAGGYWWVRNSWGTGWAEDGYFKLGYGECSVEAYAWYAAVGPGCADAHEPNDSYGEATAIGYGDTLTADICPAGDVDYYSFVGTAGDNVIVDIDAQSLSPFCALDSYLYLYDSDGVELVRNDDDDGLDSYIAYQLPADGTYYLKVRDYNHPDEGGADYFYDISLHPGCADAHEPNDSYGEATVIGYGDTLGADICPAGDEDYYSFVGTAGDNVIVDIDAQSLSPFCALDSYLYLYDSNGVELVRNDDDDGLDSYIAYQLPADGTYYLKVREYRHPNAGGADYFYDISLYDGGVSVRVLNQSGQPAANARIEVYSDTSQSPDFIGHTNATGSVSFPDVPQGTYTVVATSWSDHFLLIEENVTAPTSVLLDTGGTAQVDVHAYGLDGTTPVNSSIGFVPFFRAYPYVGATDAAGHLSVKVTPHVYHLKAASHGEPYLLVKPNVPVDGAMQVDFDPTQMPTGEVSFDLVGFPTVRSWAWGSYSNWSYVFVLGDGATMTYSADTYNLAPQLMKSDSEADWYYNFDNLDGGYSSYEVVAGGREMIAAGGEFAAAPTSDAGFYEAADSVSIASLFVDAFSNRIRWIDKYTPSTAGNTESHAQPSLAAQEPMVEHQDASTMGVQATERWSTIAPTLVVEDPHGQVIVDESSYSHTFDLSTNVVEGLYRITASVDTGPHQGLVQGAGHFAVGWHFGDFDGDCQVDTSDVQSVAGRWQSSATEPAPDGDPSSPCYDAFYDVDKDGVITVVDIMQVVAEWGWSCP